MWNLPIPRACGWKTEKLTTATVNQEGLESSLSRCVTHGILMHQNGGLCMCWETWIKSVFLCDTWFSLCMFTWKMIASFLWRWNCFRIFLWCVKRPITYAWNCFQRRYRGPSCFCLVHTRCKDFKKKEKQNSSICYHNELSYYDKMY